MKRLLVLSAALAIATTTPQWAAAETDSARITREIADTAITRDDWGIAHVHGKTDADKFFLTYEVLPNLFFA